MSDGNKPEWVRQPVLVVETPFSSAAKVALYADTVTQHIPLNRRVGQPFLPIVESTLTNPTAVCQGTTNASYYAFVSEVHASSTSASPFVVFVDPQGNPMPAVTTAGHRRDFKNLSAHTILWRQIK